MFRCVQNGLFTYSFKKKHLLSNKVISPIMFSKNLHTKQYFSTKIKKFKAKVD